MAEPESTQAQKRYKTADVTEATKRLLEKFDEHTDWEKFVFGLRDEKCFPISKPQNQTRPHTTDQTWQTQTRQHPTQAPGQTPTTSQHHSTGSCHAARGSTRRGCWTLFWQSRIECQHMCQMCMQSSRPSQKQDCWKNNG